MEIAIAPLTLHRPHPLDVIVSAAQAGYDLAGIQLQVYGQAVSPLATDADFLDAARRALAQGGIAALEVSNVVLDPSFHAADARALVAFASHVGARLVQVVGWDDNLDRATEHLAFTADVAAEAGLDVALEFMPYSCTRTLEDAVALVGATGRANARLLLDTLHLFRSGGSAASLAEVDPGLFAVIQLSDAPLVAPPPESLRAESVGDRLIPGDGELALREVLSAVPAGLPLSLEVPCKALAHLPLAEQAGRVLEGTRRFLELGTS